MNKNLNKSKNLSKSKKKNTSNTKNKSNKSYAPYFVMLDKVKYEKEAIEQHKHTHGINLSPMSGSEPIYDPVSWDKNTIKPKHNCYSYALNHKFAKRKGKAQPGYFSGYKNVPDGKYNCDTFYKRISDDSPSLFDQVYGSNIHYYLVYKNALIRIRFIINSHKTFMKTGRAC